MNIQYEIKITLMNMITSATSSVSKTFNVDLSASPASLYNNVHVLVHNIRLFDMFDSEINAFVTAQGILKSSIEIDDFEIVSLTDEVDVYFEDSKDNIVPMSPNVMCYIHSELPQLETPSLFGVAYDSTTIIWSWTDDSYPHYLIDEITDFTDGTSNEHIIAQIPIGQKTYIETGLDPDTPYTRRLVAYTTEQYSFSSDPVTIWTETAEIHRRLSEYNVARNYDFTTPDSERESIDEALRAFRSGIGDGNDLKIYKQMDTDFYQKFKAYFEITGRRTVKEKKYAQTGFNYKICLEAEETVDEQEGEIVFDVHAYPREWVVLQDYIFDTGYVKVDCRMKCTMFLRKEDAIIPAASTDHQTDWWKPVFHVEDIETTTEIPGTTQIKANPLHFIFVLDRTRSLDAFGGISAIGNAVTQAAQLINTKIKQEGGNADFSLITFAANTNEGNNGLKLTAGTIDQFTSLISSKYNYPPQNSHEGNTTNWGAALAEAARIAPTLGSPDSVVTLFFSDGFPNAKDQSGSTITGNDIDNSHYRDSYNFASVLNYVQSNASALKTVSSRVLCATPQSGQNFQILTAAAVNRLRTKPKYTQLTTGELSWYANTNFTGSTGSGAPFYAYAYSTEFVEACATSVATPGDWTYWDPNNITNNLYALLSNCIQVETTPGSSHTDVTRTITFNNEWEKTNTTTTTGLKYNLDSVLPVNLDINLYSIMFYSDQTKAPGETHKDNANGIIYVNTPVYYNRDERRAIIPASSFANGIKIGGKKPDGSYTDDIRELILAWIKEKQEWKNGYTKTVGTAESSQQESDKFLVKGLMVENTYGFADDDLISNQNFGVGAYKPGYIGSVNTYATGIYRNSEDVYLIPEANDPNNKLEILLAGYADAIIYDATVYSCYELNAFDTAHVTLFTQGQYNTQYYQQMACRKMAALKYNVHIANFNMQLQEPKHVIDIVRWDKDITISMQQGITLDRITKTWAAGDYPTGGGHPLYKGIELIQPITADIDVSYSSPVLDYRFNLEDPDAKTPLYEIIPTSDPSSTFLHIVILKVYYAKNVYVTTADNNGYIASWGRAPIPTINNQGYIADPPYTLGSEQLDEGYFRWTTKMYQYTGNRQLAPVPHTSIGAGDNGWYIDNYIWFQSKPHKKDREYYDEIPGEGMETLYGLVNSRYRKDNQSGKLDLYVDTPQFNIPATVKPGTEKIYIMISEFYPDDAIVSYKWDAGKDNAYLYQDPKTGLYKDDITIINGNNVTFSGNTIKYEDVIYDDIISTINYGGIELFNTKTTERTYQLQRPNTDGIKYEKYFLNVSTDNSDVLALRYPTEILFDPNTDEAEFNVAFKGVVNATSKWSPRIHNGYYYLNQHEFFAYSEFDVEANFEEFETINFQTLTGYLKVEVILKDRTPKPNVICEIIKDTRSQLLQDEEHFTWLNGRGLTLLPSVNSELYKKYEPIYYYSPMLVFDECISIPYKFIIDYAWYDPDEPAPQSGNYNIKGYVMPEIEFRYYDMTTYNWSNWLPLQYQGNMGTSNIGASPTYQETDPVTGNETTKTALSSAYQLRMLMSAVTTDSDYEFEDYLCCYLDWKDDQGGEGNVVNISTAADHMTNGPDFGASGTYVSKIFDYGYEGSSYQLSYFESFYHNRIELYVASSNNTKDLLIENVIWARAAINQQVSLRETGLSSPVYGRYFRYKVVIPPGEKLYWLRKVFSTKSTVATVPVIQKIYFKGEYKPAELESSFTNVEAFELIADGNDHRIFDSLTKIIKSDIERRGYTTKDIYTINTICTTNNIVLALHPQLVGNGLWPCSLNDVPIDAEVKAHTISPVYDKKIDHTPFIFSEPDDYQNESILIRGVPEQFAPITVEDQFGEPYTQLMDGVDFNEEETDFNVTDAEFFMLTEQFIIDESSVKFITLKTNRFEIETLTVSLNGTAMTDDMYRIQNNIIIFDVELSIGDMVTVTYYMMNTFIALIDRLENTTKILLYSNRNEFNQGIYDASTRRITYDKIKDIPLTAETFISPVNFKTYSFDYTHSGQYADFSNLTGGTWSSVPDGNWTYGYLASRNQEYGFTYDGDTNSTFSVYSTDYPVLEYKFDVTITSSRTDDEVIGLFLAECMEFGKKIRLFFCLDLNTRKAGCIEIDEDGNLTYTNAIQPWEPNLSSSYAVWANNGCQNDTIRVQVEKKKRGIYIVYSNFEDNNENRMDIITDTYSWYTKYDIPTDFGMFSMIQRKPQYIINNIERTEFTETQKKYKVFFETNKVNNKFAADDLSLNPIYRTDYKGFIYLTDEHNRPDSINIYCNPTTLVKGGFDRVDISIEVLDEFKNPIIGIRVFADCSKGILKADSDKTDINGVVHYVYESASVEGSDIVSFSVMKEDGTELKNSVTIKSE